MNYINKIFWEALKTPPRTSIFIKIKVIIETSLEIILYICNEKYFSNNFKYRHVMKELKNLEAIRELLASHPIYTYDYSDGLYINKEATNIQVYSIDLEDEPFAAYISGYIITYASEEVLFENLRENIISHMDLTKDADDQYYDYSPAQVEAILFGILQLTPEHQDYIITGLKKHLREFIQDDEQDEDMISQYTSIYNAIEKWESDHRETEIFQQLAVSELFNQLNK
jgi:hypothetical protein